MRIETKRMEGAREMLNREVRNNSTYNETNKKATGSMQGWANHYERLFETVFILNLVDIYLKQV